MMKDRFSGSARYVDRGETEVAVRVGETEGVARVNC